MRAHGTLSSKTLFSVPRINIAHILSIFEESVCKWRGVLNLQDITIIKKDLFCRHIGGETLVFRLRLLRLDMSRMSFSTLVYFTHITVIYNSISTNILFLFLLLDYQVWIILKSFCLFTEKPYYIYVFIKWSSPIFIFIIIFIS